MAILMIVVSEDVPLGILPSVIYSEGVKRACYEINDGMEILIVFEDTRLDFNVAAIVERMIMTRASRYAGKVDPVFV